MRSLILQGTKNVDQDVQAALEREGGNYDQGVITMAKPFGEDLAHLGQPTAS